MNKMHPAFKLAQVLDKLQVTTPVRFIWKVGSRDAADAEIMCQAFPDATVTSFEPNQATFDKVLGRAASSAGRITPRSEALTDTDGPLPFMQIDVDKTITT